MHYLEHPSQALWETRRKWFESTANSLESGGNYVLSEQACALSGDVQAAFCAGAWVAVIVLAMAVIDAQLREVEVGGFRGSTKRLLESAGLTEIQRLRRRRNELVHVDPERPGITVDQQWDKRQALEAEAREAVQLMFGVLYLSPGI